MRALLVVALLLVGCSTASPPTSTPFRQTPPVVIRPSSNTTAPPVQAETFPGPFSGDTGGETASFVLKGGDYVIDWTARNQNSSGVECYFNPAFKSNDGGYEEIASVDVSTTKSGTSNVHGVDGGTWYIDVNTHCSWTLRIHR